MKKKPIIALLLLTFVLLTFRSAAQQAAQIVFFGHQYIDTLRQTKGAKIKTSRAITQAKLSPLHKNYQLHMALIGDADLQALAAKGNSEKFNKKYLGKFIMSVFLNNNPVVIDRGDKEAFRNLLSNTSLTPFESSDGNLLVVCYLVNLSNYMGEANKKFIINGNNFFRFEISFDNSPYAKGEISLNLDASDPHGSACEIPKPKMQNPDHEKQVATLFHKFNEGATLQFITLYEDGKTVLKNSDGIPIGIFCRCEVAYKETDGLYYIKSFMTEETYLGAGKYGAAVLKEANNNYKVAISENCVKAYKTKYGIK